MELLHERRTARKVHLLNDSQNEVLVLTSGSLPASWPSELVDSLKSCALRGLRVQVLVQATNRSSLEGSLAELEAAGVELRLSHSKLPFSTLPVQAELWIFDRSELITVNRRVPAGLSASAALPPAIEFLMGADVAHGASAYFELRWKSATSPIAFSVRHKQFAFHGGQQAELEFFSCLLSAREEVSICLPGSRVSKKVESALRAALESGLKITIYANADGDNAPALKRLRRLWSAGAVVKICGHRLSTECAVVDGTFVYMGSLPSSWRPWVLRGHCPVFVVQNRDACRDLLNTLEAQVSVEMSSQRNSPSLAFR